jgi:hypothetical protein
MIPTRSKTPRCHACDRALGGARLVIGGLWTCPDCAYEREYGATERVPRSTSRRKQEERLFEVAPTRRRTG